MKLYSILATSVAVGFVNGFGRVATVTVKGDDGPLIINADDFDPKKHKKWDGEEPAIPEPTAASDPEPVEPAISRDVLVMKSGTGKNAKFFIADSMGQKIIGDEAEKLGIDEAGYATEDDAKEVQARIKEA